MAVVGGAGSKTQWKICERHAEEISRTEKWPTCWPSAATPITSFHIFGGFLGCVMCLFPMVSLLRLDRDWSFHTSQCFEIFEQL